MSMIINPFSKYISVREAAYLWNGDSGTAQTLAQRESALMEHARDGDFGNIGLTYAENGLEIPLDDLMLLRSVFLAWLKQNWFEDWLRITGTPQKMLNATEAAAKLGISRATFYRWIKQNQIPSPAEPGPPPRWADNQIQP